MIDIEKIKQYLDKAGVFIKKEARETLVDFIYNECRILSNEQKRDDIITSIVALSDVGTKECELYDLLDKYWGIDSRREAKEYIKQGRCIEWPFSRLKVYLKKEGYDNFAIVKYMHEYDVREKLKGNANLSKLNDEKLKAELEKNN